MFFRGRQMETSIWRRFRSGFDGFTFIKEDDYYAAHIVANAERTVDLLYALSEHLPPAVDVYIEDLRSSRSWKGENVALPDAREAVARLKMQLASLGGVELSIYSAEDQLTLNPHLELFIYSRTDHWLYLLEGKGLENKAKVETKSWKTPKNQFPAAPELVNAIAAAAQRLGLTPA